MIKYILILLFLVSNFIWTQSNHPKNLVGKWKIIKYENPEGIISYEETGGILELKENKDLIKGTLPDTLKFGKWSYDDLSNSISFIRNKKKDDYTVIQLTKKDLVIKGDNMQIYLEKIRKEKDLSEIEISKQEKQNQELKRVPKKLLGNWEVFKILNTNGKINKDNKKYIHIKKNGQLEGGRLGKSPNRYGNWSYNSKTNTFTIHQSKEKHNGEGAYLVKQINKKVLVLENEEERIFLKRIHQ